MPNVLVWGKIRDLIAGDPPTGMPVAEVSSLEEARAQSDSRGTLLLTSPAVIEAHAEALKSWLRGGQAGEPSPRAGRGSVPPTSGRSEASTGTLLVAVTEAEQGDLVLSRFPFVDDLLVKPVTAGRLRLRLDRAFDALHNRRVVRQLEEALARKGEELHELNQIGVKLSAERDIKKLLDLILYKSREITAADAGSLYLVERGKSDKTQTDDRLRFKLTQNDSVLVPFEEYEMPLSETSIAGYAALTGRIVNVADAYELAPGTPFRISRSFDEQSGYRTKSMLAVPMRDHKDEVIGVVQLINKKRDTKAVLRPLAVVEEQVIAFNGVDEELVSSLASQAAVAFENTRLLEDLKNLFDTFVHASVSAIEQRDPPTSGHSRRVAELTVGIAEQADAAASGPFKEVRFNRDQIQEIKYASLLHDFGKVGVRDKVFIKAKKLYVGELLLVRQRFDSIKRALEVEHLRSKLDQVLAGAAGPELLGEMDATHRARQEEIDQIVQMVLHANEPTVLEGDSVRLLHDLASRTFLDVEGKRQPYLTAEEVQALSIRKGSLSTAEREEIQTHVTNTYNFLAKLPWTGELQAVPDIAHAHHEKLDGSGYPRRLRAPEIPLQSRMMTIADIFDALVAWNRPYKKSVSPERALDILKDEARHGKVDAALVDLFIAARIYERTLPKAGAQVAR
jgi:HD-GYP domain-containing protein (c-di-GMP phosphodiesterase class II)